MRGPETYADLAGAGWRRVLDQVRWDDGPWIPESVPPPTDGIPEDRDAMHSGIGGLAHVLAEIRLARPWTDEEATLADGIASRVRRGLATATTYSYFEGFVSYVGVSTALEAPGADGAVARLAEHAAAVLMAEAERVATGTNWGFVPLRHHDNLEVGGRKEMPNWSHGLAGIAAALAVAGADLGRANLVEAARSGAEHLVTLGVTSDAGFVVPHFIPSIEDFDDVTLTWRHGPTGTSLLFSALEKAGVAAVAGESPADWRRRCLHSVRTSGLPERIRPGFWDNDGRCCGTVGVGDVFLDAWQSEGEDDDLAFALRLADVLVERAVTDGPHACWRFVEHRNAEPLLPPGVGWMQGGAGIAAYLFRTARLLRHGRAAPAVARLDTWWGLPGQ